MRGIITNLIETKMISICYSQLYTNKLGNISEIDKILYKSPKLIQRKEIENLNRL